AQLDYCYFGGIYRDVWLVATNRVHITDPNEADRVAGGGLFVATTRLSDDRREADLAVRLHLANETRRGASGRVVYTLVGPDGRVAASKTQSYSVAAGGDRTLNTKITVKDPALWSPERPDLYRLSVQMIDSRGRAVDGMMQRIGIRTVAFDPTRGFVLNGQPYPRKLIGANRHQDYAVVGNALSNNLHWRDAAKLKAAGMEIIRNAHYPQDPAFMDACDQLGLLVIVNTPGWQFWNDDPVFGERVYDDVRNMVRRDRNRPSVAMWEPILNETWYPEEFAGRVHDIVHEEYPFPGCYTACDSEAKGHEHFEIQFAHPAVGERESAAGQIDPTKVYFTREWGDNVDDWSSHNSTSRAARGWGEVPQLVQANHYARNDYSSTSYDALYRAPVYHFGGTLWHAFDHQRGYHPDPFYGGIMDAFRRPKYSYEMFRAQDQSASAKPMVFIANELTPFSPEDVTVFSNCDTVVLHTFAGADTLRTYVRGRDADTTGMPAPAIVFPGAWNFMADKALSRSGRQEEAYILVEGIRNGRVAASERKSMARRPTRLELVVDYEGARPVADGSDLITVVARMTDRNGTIKRLNNSSVRFTVEGEGVVMLPASQAAGVPLVWGEAPVLVRTTT
ncbi:MAG: glycoside hydrolase family 2 protein, partial [Rikenella sp.]|nr:glycoside hydrolase family 2 protein [Rikenella sp.]